MEYLNEVKRRFANSPKVYSQFLDVMKEFKSQEISTIKVCKSVCVFGVCFMWKVVGDAHHQGDRAHSSLSPFLPPLTLSLSLARTHTHAHTLSLTHTHTR